MARKPAYYDSQASAAAGEKVDISLIREAKRSGSTAFRSGRVYKLDLRRWLRDRNKANDPPDLGEDGQLTKTHWDRERARVDYESAVLKLEIQRQKHVELDEICAAVGQMLAGFRTAINMLPGSAARWLIGLKDFHAIKAKLETEVDAVLQALGRVKFLEFEPCDQCKAHFVQLGKQELKELQIDVGNE